MRTSPCPTCNRAARRSEPLRAWSPATSRASFSWGCIISFSCSARSFGNPGPLGVFSSGFDGGGAFNKWAGVARAPLPYGRGSVSDESGGWGRPSSFVVCLLRRALADDKKRSSAPPLGDAALDKLPVWSVTIYRSENNPDRFSRLGDIDASSSSSYFALRFVRPV